jgi:hypothetical protein
MQPEHGLEARVLGSEPSSRCDRRKREKSGWAPFPFLLIFFSKLSLHSSSSILPEAFFFISSSSFLFQQDRFGWV